MNQKTRARREVILPLALITLTGLSAESALAGAAALVPHQAVYEITLERATTASGIADMTGAKANFLQADINQDQQLDFGEFTTFINLNADNGLGRAPMIRRFGMHSRALGRLDTNRDSVVSRQELASQVAVATPLMRRPSAGASSSRG